MICTYCNEETEPKSRWHERGGCKQEHNWEIINNSIFNIKYYCTKCGSIRTDKPVVEEEQWIQKSFFERPVFYSGPEPTLERCIMVMTPEEWYEKNNCKHGHCPKGCEHPQPMIYKDDRLICGRCAILNDELTDILPCTPEVCE